MKTGYRGTFVITCNQTELDGLTPASLDAVREGAVWRWWGQALRIDGPDGVLCLGNPEGGAELRARAARAVRKLAGQRDCGTLTMDSMVFETETPAYDRTFTVTDGIQTYQIAVADGAPGSPSLFVCVDALPPTERDLWVVDHTLENGPGFVASSASAAVVCFTPGTRLRTPAGERLVESLVEGDQVLTKDNGAQEIHWIGHEDLSGARLFALPQHRPVRLRAGALDIGQPTHDLLVSPDHQIVLGGAQALALFNQPEVLVPARALVNDRSVIVDHSVRAVRYIHLLLAEHQIVWANGVETDTFHPGYAALEGIAPAQRDRLFATVPGILDDPFSYGDPVRRILSAAEASIFLEANRR